MNAGSGEPPKEQRLKVEPLGVFGPRRSTTPTATPEVLRAMAGGFARELSASVARYLRAGHIIFAIMGYTRDMLEGRFEVAGGAAILTDGTYYWRQDAADYVEEYNIAVPEEALTHMEALGWTPPVLDDETESRIDQYLWNELEAPREGEVRASTIKTFYPGQK